MGKPVVAFFATTEEKEMSNVQNLHNPNYLKKAPIKDGTLAGSFA
jgi:hypothetical protein